MLSDSHVGPIAQSQHVKHTLSPFSSQTNILQYPKEIEHLGHKKVVVGTLSHGIWSPLLLNWLIYTFTKRLLKATFAFFRAKLGIYFDSQQVWGGSREIIL